MVEGGERLVEGAAEVGEYVESGSLDAARVEVTGDKAVSLGTTERVSQHFVRHTVESIIEVLVAATAIAQLSEDIQGPTTRQQFDDLTRVSRINHRSALRGGRLGGLAACRCRLAGSRWGLDGP
jgi:hypothetical protein